MEEGRRKARRLARSRGFSCDEIEDLEQDLIWTALVSLPSFDPSKGNVEAWIVSVIGNRAKNLGEARRAACRDYRKLDGSLQDLVPTEDGGVVERGETFGVNEYLRRTRRKPQPIRQKTTSPPEDRAGLRADLARVRDGLPARLRAVLDVLLRDPTAADGARTLGVSPSTFYERRSALVDALRTAGLEDYLR